MAGQSSPQYRRYSIQQYSERYFVPIMEEKRQQLTAPSEEIKTYGNNTSRRHWRSWKQRASPDNIYCTETNLLIYESSSDLIFDI